MNKITQFITYLFFVLIFFVTESNGSIVILNGLTQENSVEPGSSYRGTIQLQNVGKAQKNVKVYLKDYWYSYTGESKHDPGGTLARSNANWISYNPEILTLDSAEIATIDFEVTVPDNDSLRGTFWSVIMVEGIVEVDTANRQQGVRINTAIRYAIQVISNVGSEGNSDLQFLGMELAREDSANILNVAIENTGEWILRPEMSLELFDETGATVSQIKGESRKTLPGTSVMSSLVLENIQAGKYTGVLVADCGNDRLYGTNLSIEIE
ncbi:hypothetical protein [uncultured Draconibacterium sp.]|uniref:hypothetical protein n=1 Tax=uncultured Draconibacterium sp. TaxID=1573823 RepID=UPI0025F0074A|nr:hypothetical protein [uncultured Draconibacterium sp.]